MLPFVPAANPFSERVRVEVRQLRADRHARRAVILLTIWWKVSAKHWFTGPKHTIDPVVAKLLEE